MCVSVCSSLQEPGEGVELQAVVSCLRWVTAPPLVPFYLKTIKEAIEFRLTTIRDANRNLFLNGRTGKNRNKYLVIHLDK